MQEKNECERTDRLLRLPEVERICGLRKTTIYQLINDGRFPPGFRVGRSRLWRWSVIQEWVKSHHDEWSVSPTGSVEYRGVETHQKVARQVVGVVPAGTRLTCPSSLRSDGDASCWKETS
ncbi:helix-turn-helix transcriptional regulator [Sideroxydans sp.]